MYYHKDLQDDFRLNTTIFNVFIKRQLTDLLQVKHIELTNPDFKGFMVTVHQSETGDNGSAFRNLEDVYHTFLLLLIVFHFYSLVYTH